MMSRRSPKSLTDLEREAIETIKSLRTAHLRGLNNGDIGQRAEFLRDLLIYRHGSAKLRLKVLCLELGCTQRSLQREFLSRYSESAHYFQENRRLEYAKQQMEMNPNLKLTALASELGYDRENEFRRFFSRKEGMSPREFLQKVRHTQSTSYESTDLFLNASLPQ